MTKAIDYRVIWTIAHRAARVAKLAKARPGFVSGIASNEPRVAAHAAARNSLPGRLANSALSGWHVDRIARCAAGETVMSKGLARRAMWLDAAGQMRRYAVSDAVLTNPHGGRADYLALARGLLSDNARNASTFVAPLP